MYEHLYAQQANVRLGLELARAYTVGDLKGWEEGLSRDAFLTVGKELNEYGSPIFKQLNIDPQPYLGKKTMLYNVCRKVLGKDTPNYPQQIGDCVSFGAKNGTEYITCTDILMKGVREQWKAIFPPYYYGTSRVQIGGGQLGNGDGSTGAWMAAAVIKYGALFSEYQGVPQYSGSVAKTWGRKGPPEEFIPVAQKHLIHSAAQINSWEDLVAAISNGYACPTASNVGYEMEAGSDGFHRMSGSWGHQMCFIGVGFAPEEYAIILNNWGDVHGHLKDFDGEGDLPAGVLRVKRRSAEAHIRAQETYAYSQFDGFPEQDIDKALFKVIGN